MLSSGIYCIRNTEDGRVYIGSAVNLVRRLQDHKKALRAGNHRSKRMQRAWLAFGPEAFTFEVLERVEIPDLLVTEQKWLDVVRSYPPMWGYNTAIKASSPMLGLKHTSEARLKMSAAQMGNSKTKGRAQTPEHRAKVSAAKLGNKNWEGRSHSALSRQKISAALTGRTRSAEHSAALGRASKGNKYCLGRPVSEETRAKLRAAATGKRASPETRAKMRAASLGRPKAPAHREKLAQLLRARNSR